MAQRQRHNDNDKPALKVVTHGRTNQQLGNELQNLLLKACRAIAVAGESSGKRIFSWLGDEATLLWSPNRAQDGSGIVLKIAREAALSHTIQKAVKFTPEVEINVSPMFTSIFLHISTAQVFAFAQRPLADVGGKSIITETLKKVKEHISVGNARVLIREQFRMMALRFLNDHEAKNSLPFKYDDRSAKANWGPSKGQPGFYSFYVSIENTIIHQAVWEKGLLPMDYFHKFEFSKKGTTSMWCTIDLDGIRTLAEMDPEAQA